MSHKISRSYSIANYISLKQLDDNDLNLMIIMLEILSHLDFVIFLTYFSISNLNAVTM